MRRHSIFISYYNIYYYYYYNTTVNGRVHAWTLRGVLLCARCVLVFRFSGAHCTIIINPCCASDAGASSVLSSLRGYDNGPRRPDHKNATRESARGDSAALMFEKDRAKEWLNCRTHVRQPKESVCVTNYYDIFIISYCIIIII